MKLSAAKVDSAAIEAGEWVGDIPDMGDIAFRVRGLDNADYRKRQAILLRAVPRAERVGGRLSPKRQDAILTQLLVETCLMDWRNVEGDDGKPIPFSRETAAKLLGDPDLRPFRDAVLYAAGMVGEQAAADTEADAGN